MRYQGWSLVFYFCLHAVAAGEWVVMHSTLPTVSTEHPEAFVVNLVWVDEDKEKTTNITLSLEKSEAVGKNIPYFENNEKGTPVLTSFIDMKHTTFYQDLKYQASISLTSFGNKEFSLQGSFMVGDEKYDIEPYHPKVHKRSLGAKESDHIVKRRSTDERKENTDYKMPEKGSEDYDRVQRAQVRFRALQEMEGRKKRSAEESDPPTDYKVPEPGSKEEERISAMLKTFLKDAQSSVGLSRKRRDTLPRTTYTVEIYMMIDYYLYEILKESAEILGWPGGVDDYIAFFIAHQANEVDVIYRGIYSGGYPVYGSWNIGTKLSYLNVVKTTGASPWTHPPTKAVSMQIDAEIGLESWRNWVDATANLPAADHFMLITGLDLEIDGNPNVDGLCYLGGICSRNKTSFCQFGYATIYAHELGHNLGAFHDGDDNSCNGEDQYVMSAVGEVATPETTGHTWKFSRCSVQYFDSFFNILEYDHSMCLTNSGNYISSWAEDSLTHLGQQIPLDEQCRLWEGDGNYYVRSEFDRVCSTLVCTNGSGYGYIDADRTTLPTTSCGNRKWCIKSLCVYDPEAPELDETCPFEDKKGPVFFDSDVTCAELDGNQCKHSEYARLYCCRACRALATPWLGPNCTYGDIVGSICTDVNITDACTDIPDLCCQTCCPYLGPDDGYSCIKPSTTTTTTTTAPTTTGSITAKASSAERGHGFSPVNKAAVLGGIGAGIAVVIIVGVICAKKEQLRAAKVNCCRAKDEDSSDVAYVGMT